MAKPIAQNPASINVFPPVALDFWCFQTLLHGGANIRGELRLLHTVETLGTLGNNLEKKCIKADAINCFLVVFLTGSHRGAELVADELRYY